MNKKDHLEDRDVERRIIDEMDREVKCVRGFCCFGGEM